MIHWHVTVRARHHHHGMMAHSMAHTRQAADSQSPGPGLGVRKLAGPDSDSNSEPETGNLKGLASPGYFPVTRNLKENRDVIVYQRKSMIGRPKIRVWISYLYRIILGFGFNLPKVDFNGIILIKSEIIKKLQLKSNSNFISAEIILRSKMKQI